MQVRPSKRPSGTAITQLEVNWQLLKKYLVLCAGALTEKKQMLHSAQVEKRKSIRGETRPVKLNLHRALPVLQVEALYQTLLTKIPEHTFCSLIQLPHQLEVPLQLTRQVFDTWNIKAKKYYSLFSS